MSPRMMSGRVAHGQQGVRRAVHGDQHGAHVAQVGRSSLQVFFVAFAAHDDQRVTARDLDAAAAAGTSVGSSSRSLSASRYCSVLRANFSSSPPRLARAASWRLRDARVVPARQGAQGAVVNVQAVAGVNVEALAVAQAGEQVRVGQGEQGDARGEQHGGAAVGILAGDERAGVDDGGRARFGEGARGQRVQVGVVDHGDVAGPQPCRQVFRAPVHPRRAGQSSQRPGRRGGGARSRHVGSLPFVCVSKRYTGV